MCKYPSKFIFLKIVAVPTFAQRLDNCFPPSLSYNGKSYSKDSSFSADAGFMFQMGKTDLYIGHGITWNQKHKVVDSVNTKFGFTNIFVVAKYKFKATIQVANAKE